jgi:FkbM family methyltransferase
MKSAEYLRLACNSGVSLFGAGGFARDLAHALSAQGVPVHGYFTSDEPARASLDGLPVRRLSSEVPGALLVIGVFNREVASDYGSIAAMLSERGVTASALWPQQTYDLLAEALGYRYWLHPRDAYAAEAEAIVNARNLFEDEASRRALDTLLAFRRDDSRHAYPPAPESTLQYLPAWLEDELVSRGSGSINLVDAGAYRGETLRALADRLPITQAWSFEPDPTNYAALIQALADWPEAVTNVPAALGEQTGSIAFSASGGEASHVGSSGGCSANQLVPLVTLDEAVNGERVDFIKFDVEGHELPALRGSFHTLQRCRPVLAIAAYHRWDDLWSIPGYLASLKIGYRFRLGLHGHNSFDSVLYAY